jgi:hypothetical protein
MTNDQGGFEEKKKNQPIINIMLVVCLQDSLFFLIFDGKIILVESA